jgi:hypothetical protein
MKRKKVAEKYYTVGVRYARGHDIARVFTYRVAKGKRLKLGDEVVADTTNGPCVAFVVQIDATPQDTLVGINYKYLTRKAVPL